MPVYVNEGAELSVNSATAFTQSFSRVAGFAGGGYVVVWNTTDPGQDSDGGAVKAQLFDASGAKVGTEFLVNSSAAGTQTTPAVTTLPDGGFVVAWATTDSAQDGSAGAIKAQVFSAAGTPVGGEFLVNVTAAGNQSAPNLVTLANGAFLATWDDAGSTDVFGRIFTAGGAPASNEFKLNTNVTGSQNFNDVSALANAGFVAVWRSTDTAQDGSSDSVKGQVFDQAGNKVGGEFLLNTNSFGAQTDPSVTALTGGGFVVAWVTSANSEDGSSSAIKAQLFDAAGAKVGGEFLVNAMAASAQQEPVVTALPDGEFMVVWMTLDAAQDGSGLAVKAQVFDAAGARIGTEFLVNTQATGNQSVADVATLSDGRVIVTWTDTNGDGPANWAIRGQIFAPEGPPDPVNHAPVITSNGGGDLAAVAAEENSALVTTVMSTDPDGQALTYSIVGGADAASFTIGTQSGILAFVSAPDFELPADADGDGVYEVVVSSSDGTLADSQALLVTVGNVDEPIVFTSSNNIIAPENFSLSHAVTAVEPDNEAATMSYGIVAGADAGLFSIDAATGVLTFNDAPDHEAPADAGGDNVYEVVVSASDGMSMSTQAVTIRVYDVDEAPIITSNGGGTSAALTVAENGTAVTTVTATDAEGRALHYAIVGGNDAALFAIDPESGVLTFLAAPDFEAPADFAADNFYTLTVAASDGTLSVTQNIEILVTNLNEGVTITSLGGGDSADIGLAENSAAVTTVSATDFDGDGIIYSLSGGADAALFTVDEETGEIRFRVAPDFESPADADGDNVYELIVTARDGSFSDTQALRVSVGNVNEGVTINSGGGGATASLSVAENSLAVTNVVATDADGTPVTYAIVGGADAARFMIDATTGALRFVTSPNHEAPTDAGANNVYDVIVSASDGSLGDVQALAVTVGNVNEGVTIQSGGGGASASVSVAENSLAVTNVVATDADGTPVTYAIVGGADAARFTIDPTTGALRFVTSPNHEAPTDAGANNVYDVIVSASDGVLADTQALSVTVSNVREGNTIIGTAGKDTVSLTKSVPGQSRATELEDTISGLGGADSLSGAGGADIIDGGAGNDDIIGGLGADVLKGGTGADRFVFNLVGETAPGARDVITDFSRAEGDKISLSGIDANINVNKDQSFSFIGTNAFSGAAGQLRYELVDGTTIVSGDVNGDRVADFQIELSGPVTLGAVDFIL